MSDPFTSSPPAAISDLHPGGGSPRKIYSPAGNRLQTVLEGGDGPQTSYKPGRLSHGQPTSALGLAGQSESGTEPSYTTIWSDAGLAAKEESTLPSRHLKWVTRRGGWKRLLLLLLVLVAIIVGLVVGLVVGLRAQSSDDHSASQPTTTTGPDSIPQASAPATTTTIGGTVTQPTSALAGTPTSTPSGFPLGAYSFVTFLDTVSTDCTSNPSTWRCAPYTLYSDNPTQAMTTFNWNITVGASADSFRISSISNPFQTSFSDITLSLVDAGKDTEHYFFQALLDKQVRPTSALTDNDAATICFYNSTTFQGSLYTKEAKGYPTKDMTVTAASYQSWPFAVRVEEVIGGGDGVPNCYIATNNQIGDRVNSSSLTPRPAGDLCDCLYLNYLT